MLAIGYEGPETLGTVVAAAAIVVATILLTLLLTRGLVSLAGRLHPADSAHRPRHGPPLPLG